MQKYFLLILSCFFISTSIAQPTMIEIPPQPKSDVVEDYHGMEIPDPYRWLEETGTAQTQEWMMEQNNLSMNYLHAIPYRAQITARLKEVWNYPRQSAPFKRGKKYYYFKNNGLQEQSVLIELASFSYPEEVYFDPNEALETGEVMKSSTFSPNGKWFAYQVSKKGSDWRTIKVRDHGAKRPMNDVIEGVKFSGIAWLGDGFFYKRYNMPGEEDMHTAITDKGAIYYHKVGYPQSNDIKIMDIDKTSYSISVNREETYVFLYGSTDKTHGNSLAYRKAEGNVQGDFITLVEGTEHKAWVISDDLGKLFIMTNKGAENFRLVEIDLKKPEEEKWKTLIETPEGMVMKSVRYASETFIVTYMKDAHHVMYAYDRKGKLIDEIKLPGLGTVGGVKGEKDSKTLYFSYTSFAFPTVIMKYTISTNKARVYYEPTLEFDPREYTVKQDFYNSKDGTKIPIYIIHKNPIAMFNENPTYLYGYGGFNISQLPRFNPSYIPFLEKGGVIAIPCIRGGGEYGEAWHKAGMLEKKQNVFDDFIAAAEYLIKEKYTSPKKLAIGGRSNGGLLVGAVMNQRPDLFAVAQPTVGVMDMLRYHKFTIGWAWVKEYGSADVKGQFDYLYKYSPLHNIRSGKKYPATFVMTSDYDDRVVPAHSFKYTATLQEYAEPMTPIILRVYQGKGHGTGAMTQKLEEWTDRWAFISWHLGMDWQ